MLQFTVKILAQLFKQKCLTATYLAPEGRVASFSLIAVTMTMIPRMDLPCRGSGA